MTTATRVAVLGCGAIGSLYAAHLARVPGVEVWAVDPWAEHMRTIAHDGLRVTGAAEFVAPVHGVTRADDLPPCEFAIVATKSQHTRAAVEAARAPLQGAAVVSVQNGIGNEDTIATVLPHVIRGSIVTAGTVTAPGIVRYDAPGDSWFGPFEPSPAPLTRVERLAALLTEGGLRTHALADARGPQWTKVVFNASTSPLSALTGLSIGQVCTDPGLRPLVDALIAEAEAVCEAAGITLLRDPRDAVEEAITEAFWHRPSMLQDVEARHLTEVDVLCGGIVAEGARTAVPTPLHQAMTALVHGLEDSWTTGGPR
ncbi:ketopantoate reductase family protein [Demequina capsici]|uniref:2-dehydropantoate 2-reductase n=1 Tax=Demequina capsici TaxID=3075620 RepID=A0AA96J7W2_9MICO|nr:2-dehydropantoate 2-reductase [Demequina sp. OYTSA14]WNM25632.1 2-dehydropantoate 2-reductase [Demequina sp. OYTSA14]